VQNRQTGTCDGLQTTRSQPVLSPLQGTVVAAADALPRLAVSSALPSTQEETRPFGPCTCTAPVTSRGISTASTPAPPACIQHRHNAYLVDHELSHLESYYTPMLQYHPPCLAQLAGRRTAHAHPGSNSRRSVRPSSLACANHHYAHATPTLFRPFNEPKLSASPCDRLRIRTNPVMGPLSPSFSMLRLASASSPILH
jgi:hypothetical protein